MRIDGCMRGAVAAVSKIGATVVLMASPGLALAQSPAIALMDDIIFEHEQGWSQHQLDEAYFQLGVVQAKSGQLGNAVVSMKQVEDDRQEVLAAGILRQALAEGASYVRSEAKQHIPDESGWGLAGGRAPGWWVHGEEWTVAKPLLQGDWEVAASRLRNHSELQRDVVSFAELALPVVGGEVTGRFIAAADQEDDYELRDWVERVILAEPGMPVVLEFSALLNQVNMDVYAPMPWEGSALSRFMDRVASTRALAVPPVSSMVADHALERGDAAVAARLYAESGNQRRAAEAVAAMDTDPQERLALLAEIVRVGAGR
ncbi:hypothetical protein [Aquisalimonas asiatica]|uniref:Uncharacterized protein n=1 Tax=Aquisalimonas asiatica TaxID=406100 RepID=A0A1H8VHP4_9GAMM|nr:hypothetical protein [Aquisalimonas asiatica]SEP14935.1 hypothetical protein SAMN04488052_11289 [Aquisalimonas asiatica]